MSVRAAIEGGITGVANESIAAKGLAAIALELADQMDDPENSATSKSMCARALIEALERLQALAPAERKGALVDLKSSRALRLVAGKPTA